MKHPALVVFDMAGTTVEDRGQVSAAFAAALAAHGITATAAQINRVRGASKRQAILQLVPPGPHQAEDVARIYASFRGELAGRYVSQGVRPVAGAPEVMRTLRERGIRVALTTGFDRDTTELLLTKLGWLDRTADTIVCGDDVEHGRPAPDLILRAMRNLGVASPAAVAAVGDTTLDLEAGFTAGVAWNIGVLSGAHGRDAMMGAPHTHLIESVADLIGVWE